MLGWYGVAQGANAPLVVHASAHGLPPELLTDTPLHRLEVDMELLDIDGTLVFTDHLYRKVFEVNPTPPPQVRLGHAAGT